MQTAVNNYESIYILKPEVDEKDQKIFFQKNKKILDSFSGEINHLDSWGSRQLSNPIKKFYRGTYFHMTFSANADAIQELERNMLINEDVLRFFHKRLDDRTTLPKHVEEYKETLTISKQKQEERMAKKAAMKKTRKPYRS